MPKSEVAGLAELGAQKVVSGFDLEDYLIPSLFTHQVRTDPCAFFCEIEVAALHTLIHTMGDCMVKDLV